MIARHFACSAVLVLTSGILLHAQMGAASGSSAAAAPSGLLVAVSLLQSSGSNNPAQSPTGTPDPRPETPAPSPQSPGQTAPAPDAKGEAHAEGEVSDSTAQTFTGTISKEGPGYVLKVQESTAYQLDDQDKAKEFDGQKVRVKGVLSRDSNMIHVQKIEPLT